MNAWLSTFLAVMALAAVRNEVVHRITMRRLFDIHSENEACIESGEFDVNAMTARYYEFDTLRFFSMFFDLRRWTYRQFFPEEA